MNMIINLLKLPQMHKQQLWEDIKVRGIWKGQEVRGVQTLGSNYECNYVDVSNVPFFICDV